MSRAPASNGMIPRHRPGLLRAYRWLLPTLGLAAMFLAVPLAADGVGSLTLGCVIVLLALGSATLVTSAATVRWIPPAPRPTHPAQPIRPHADPFPRPPAGARHGVPFRPRPTARRTLPGVAPMASLAGSADLIWESVTTPVVGSMPVELIPPVGDAPFVPTQALDPMAFEPYGERTRAEPSPIPAPRRASEAPLSARAATWSSGPSAAEISFGPRREFLDLEALTPTPPHLRPTPPPSKPRAPHPVDGPGMGCASCDRSLGEAPTWQRCTVCRDPMCSDCLVRALVEQERAWCRGCAEWDEIEESYRSLNTPASDRRSAS